MKAHRGAVVLLHKDFPCATSKRGHESNNLDEQGRTVGPLAITPQKQNLGETKPVCDCSSVAQRAPHSQLTAFRCIFSLQGGRVTIGYITECPHFHHSLSAERHVRLPVEIINMQQHSQIYGCTECLSIQGKSNSPFKCHYKKFVENTHNHKSEPDVLLYYVTTPYAAPHLVPDNASLGQNNGDGNDLKHTGGAIETEFRV